MGVGGTSHLFRTVQVGAPQLGSDAQVAHDYQPDAQQKERMALGCHTIRYQGYSKNEQTGSDPPLRAFFHDLCPREGVLGGLTKIRSR